QTRVPLRDPRDVEERDRDVDDVDLGEGARMQSQPPDRQRVRERRGGDVEIGAALKSEKRPAGAVGPSPRAVPAQIEAMLHAAAPSPRPPPGPPAPRPPPPPPAARSIRPRAAARDRFRGGGARAPRRSRAARRPRAPAPSPLLRRDASRPPDRRSYSSVSTG